MRAEVASSEASMGASAAAMDPRALASTVTCWETSPMFNATEMSWSCPAVSCTVRRLSANPGAETSMVYRPGVSPLREKWPCASTLTLRTLLVDSFFTLTVAF